MPTARVARHGPCVFPSIRTPPGTVGLMQRNAVQALGEQPHDEAMLYPCNHAHFGRARRPMPKANVTEHADANGVVWLALAGLPHHSWTPSVARTLRRAVAR